jgi:hypothetical protein
MPETSPRILAAARALFNLDSGFAPDDRSEWNAAPSKVQNGFIERAAVLVAAIDATDDRIRLTLPQFLNIKAQTVSDLSIDLHSRHGADPTAQGVLATVEQVRAGYGDRYLDPIDHEEAMASLVQERLAASLRDTADSFDRSSLQDVTAGFDFEHGMAPRTLRKVIMGCADWLRSHADDLDAETRRPYFRVDTRAIIDEDRHTAVLGVLGRLVSRSKSIAQRDGRDISPFIMTDMLVEELARVGADVGAAA